MIHVYMLPTPIDAATDTSNAINQIVLRLQEHLPAYDVEIQNVAAGADLIAGHAGQTDGKTVCDVAHVHGLYPTAISPTTETPDWHWGANKHVIDNVKAARAVTVPSEWVADLFRRDMHLNPDVIGWAIDPAEWQSQPEGHYVLWNKTRADSVCDPTALLHLAGRCPQQLFVSTFGEGTPNIKTTGRLPYADMKPYVQQASVYLATTKETFGIGTLEAMACRVPILGYRWGATADLVQHGVSGYLVEPGDLDGLVQGLAYCLENRSVLGENARRVAISYTWDRVAERFAAIYRRVLEPHTGPKVSVIVPCHNYAQYVGEAIDSVKAQETTFPYELIVVLDRCTDNSADVVLDHTDVPYSDVLIVDNGNPADTRNAGIQRARGEYICCLDADDMLGNPHYLQTLADALDADRTLGIAFTGITLMDAQGHLGGVSRWPAGYNFDQQAARQNQVPTCNLFRRTAWERAGGYRRIYCPAEDAELWLRMGIVGYGAMQVTTEGWFWYRMHGNSLSTDIRTGAKPEPHWTLDKPWLDGHRPFAAGGTPPRWSWPVRNYDQPRVSFVVPCAPHHRELLKEALDSIEAQTEHAWECVVIDDAPAGVPPLDLPGYPWIRVIAGGGRGAGHARNIGVEAARAPLIAFLDADDTLSPRYLDQVLRAYARTGRYVYTDWIGLAKNGEREPHVTPEFEAGAVFHSTSIHSINVLIPKAAIVKVGGFDEKMPAWEDVEFFMRLAKADICGVRVADYLVLYRYQTGSLRERGETIKPALLDYLRERYAPYISGERMCGCIADKKRPGAPVANGKALTQEDTVRIEYLGPLGQHAVIGPVTKQNYGRRANGDIFFVYVPDQQAAPNKFQVLVEVGQTIESTAVPPPPELIKEPA